MTEQSPISTITPTYLTDVLRKAQILGACEVCRVVQERLGGSPHSYLHLSYSAAVPCEAPQRLFMKVGRQGQGYNSREAVFYRKMAHLISPLVTAKCYTIFEQQDGSIAIFLQDVSETHVSGMNLDFPPPDPQCLTALNTLARFHAFWWEEPSTCENHLARYLTSEETYLRFVERDLAYGWQRFVDRFSDCVTEERRLACDAALRELPALWHTYFIDRLEKRCGLTLNHGDLHPGNLLFPKDPNRGNVLFADMEAYRVDLPTADLSMLIALHWSQDPGVALHLLRHYHEALCSYGVDDYSWEMLLQDYRVSMLFACFFPHYLLSIGIEDVAMFDAGVDALMAWSSITPPGQ